MNIAQTKFEQLLKEKIGLDQGVMSSQEITRILEQRRQVCNCSNLNAYFDYVNIYPGELQELIEAIVVGETWFFRDREPFKFLARSLNSKEFSWAKFQPLRILSVPCASGEEPYSIAIALLDAGLYPHQFQIDAVDISKKSLQKAEKAVYSRNSFRGHDLEFRTRYFTMLGQEYQLSENIRKTVNFRQGNLLDSDFLNPKNRYDIIFCRNVLIYFDSTARAKTLNTLNRLLTETGLLFVGASETSQLKEYGFESIRQPFVFAYRKISKNQQQTAFSFKTQKDLNSANQQHLEQSQRLLTSKIKPEEPVIKPRKQLFDSPPQQLSSLNLKTIRHLADLGQLKEAAKLCESYIQHHSTQVEAYVLLGQIYQGSHQETLAEQYFQKALYLEPNHYEALLHLMLLKEQHGEVAKATILRQRLQRLQPL